MVSNQISFEANAAFFLTLAAFESLSELVKGKLRESLDQSSLENHLKLLEALIKHWKGEVLSVSVTRIAENCKSQTHVDRFFCGEICQFGIGSLTQHKIQSLIVTTTKIHSQINCVLKFEGRS